MRIMKESDRVIVVCNFKELEEDSDSLYIRVRVIRV